MRVRFVEFRDDQVVNLPGRQGARNAHAFDPERVDRGGFELDIDLETQTLTYSVPAKSVSANNGASLWEDKQGNPIHGCAPVGHLPMSVVKRYELFQDMTPWPPAAPKPDQPKPAKK